MSESASFPILCQTCLGPNPYMRMTKDPHGDECRICSRPYTVFRWATGRGMRFKRTEICQNCSRMKNVCQTCILDLTYNLPVQVRDQLLGIKEKVPNTDQGRNHVTNLAAAAFERLGEDAAIAGGPAAMGMLENGGSLVAALPAEEEDAPGATGGECKRGDECPYRHELPSDPSDPLSKQNIKDRFYGTNDPVAEKILNKATRLPSLPPPEDKSITTLYVGNLDDSIGEDDLRDAFYIYGEIRSITLSKKAACAFVQFTTRNGAEQAANKTFNNLTLNNRKLKIMWGKSPAAQGAPGTAGGIKLKPVPGLPGAVPVPGSYVTLPPPPPLSNNSYNGNAQPNDVYYPSQDPMRLGSGRGPKE